MRRNIGAGREHATGADADRLVYPPTPALLRITPCARFAPLPVRLSRTDR
jgi:hypothetical protein